MISKIFYLVPGFNVWDQGKKTVAKFKEPIEARGHAAKVLPYGWTGLAGVRLCDQKLAMVLAALSEPGTIFLGHSNGCAIGSFAADNGAPFEGMIFINPALDRTWRPPEQVKWLHVYYNKHDWATFVAAGLVAHRWGAMGHLGPDYDDARVKVYDTGEMWDTFGHSGVFHDFNFWGHLILTQAEKEIEK